MTCQEANDAQFEELLKTATPDDLRELARDLRKRLAAARVNTEWATGAAKLNQETIANMQRLKSRR